MNKPLFALLSLAFLAVLPGCDDFDEQPPACPDGRCPFEPQQTQQPGKLSPYPVVDLPPQLRQGNWGGGSCYHASLCNVARAQGQFELAQWWHDNYRGGEYTDRLVKRINDAGLRFAWTDKGDMAFLEWCTRTNRWAAIPYFPGHAINFVTMDEKTVWLFDNNHTSEYLELPRAEFENNWKHRYGGDAVTLVYSPLPAPAWVGLLAN